jgi:GTP-binding protein EngB required for normal cell division
MTDMKNRLRRKLMTARSELDNICALIDVNVDEFEDDRKTERFLKETSFECLAMANRLDTLFTDASEKL